MVGSPAEVREAEREVVPGEASVAERNLLAGRAVVSVAARNPVEAGSRVVAADNPVAVAEAVIGFFVAAETPVGAVGVAGANHPNRVPASLWSAHYQAAHLRSH
jgi:hypothetical protein